MTQRTIGRYWEDFEAGDEFEHPFGRTITSTDDIWFTLLTQNTAALHVDHAYAAQTEFGRPLVNSTLTRTIYSRSRVLETRASRSRPEVGVLTVATDGYNQDGTVVCSFKRTLLVYRRGRGPTRTRPSTEEP